MEGVTLRIALDLNLFILLKDGDKSLDQLVEVTKAAPDLLGIPYSVPSPPSLHKSLTNKARILRSLAANGAVRETGPKTYTLSPSYILFTNPQFATGIAHCFDFLNPSYLALPGFLKSTSYISPTDQTNGAVQRAFDSKGKDLIGILTERPEAGMGFGTLMSTWGEGNSIIQDLYPVKDLANGFKPETAMWVDVGGGYGQKTIALKCAHPELPGRFVVQDLPGTVQNAPKIEGIEFLGHDFFTEQPIKGLYSNPRVS